VIQRTRGSEEPHRRRIVARASVASTQSAHVHNSIIWSCRTAPATERASGSVASQRREV